MKIFKVTIELRVNCRSLTTMIEASDLKNAQDLVNNGFDLDTNMLSVGGGRNPNAKYIMHPNL